MLCECTRLWLRRGTRSPSVSWEGCAREDCEVPRSLARAFSACTDVTDVPSVLVLTSTLLPPAVCTVVAGALGWELRGDARCRTMLSSRFDMFDGVRKVKFETLGAPGFQVSRERLVSRRNTLCEEGAGSPLPSRRFSRCLAHAAVEHTATIAMSEEVHYSGYLTKSPPNIER
jgi:hypothetical protein